MWKTEEDGAGGGRGGDGAGKVGEVFSPGGFKVCAVGGEGVGVGEGLVVEGEDEDGGCVVLEVGAYGWEILFDADAGCFEDAGWTDATGLKKLRSLNGASGEDDFFAGVHLAC